MSKVRRRHVLARVVAAVATFLLCPCLSERHGVPRALNHKKNRQRERKKNICI